MKHNLWLRTRTIAASICLSAGILAIANVETIWQEYHSFEQRENNDVINAGMGSGHKKIKINIPVESQAANYKPLQSALSKSLEQDEIKDENPFAKLASLDALQLIMQKGVVKFHRETFRSPDYQDESGYDILSYEVDHTDGSQSRILVYLDRLDPSTWRNVGAPDQRVPVVVFMVSLEEGFSNYSAFRNGQLIEQSKLPDTDAHTLVAKRLSLGVPFLSVSR